MKKLTTVIMALSLFSAASLYGCQPSGNNRSTDQHNSNGEGAIDSSRIPHIDSLRADSTSK